MIYKIITRIFIYPGFAALANPRCICVTVAQLRD